MRIRRRRMWAGAVLAGALSTLLAVSGVPAEQKEKRGESPHGRKSSDGCIVCHTQAPSEVAGQRPAAGLKFGGDIIALCYSCHDGYRHMHPVKIAIAPEMKRPEDLPLDRNGKITCITCHDVMEKAGVHRKRKVTGRNLCLNCHVESDILAQVNWYPTRLKKGESGRLEIKAVEFRIPASKTHLGESVLLYYYARDVDTGAITFGTNILYDDGTHGDRVARDSIYTLIEEAPAAGKKHRLVYTAWVIDVGGRKSNTVTLAVEYQ
ncbi:MAG: MULTIHEME CYTC protein [Actinobacteria bacterium]|nr:MULTIHEME CYTC protein [Actinomycetota bacterium]